MAPERLSDEVWEAMSVDERRAHTKKAKREEGVVKTPRRVYKWYEDDGTGNTTDEQEFFALVSVCVPRR